MATIQKIVDELISATKDAEKKKTAGYDTTAEVVRIDGRTAWVHIPGGVDETPVNLTINAEVGQTVMVRVSGGRAWLTGNSTAPPTDDKRANIAKAVADTAQGTAEEAQATAETAEEIARSASEAARSVNQYFWHTETDTGAGAGAHITEIPQEDFLADPTNGGGNLLAQSDGLRVRKGVEDLATFGADGQSFNNEHSRAVFVVGRLEPQTFGGKYNSFAYDGSSPFVFELPWETTSIINIKYYDSTGARVTDIPLHSGYTRDGREITIDAATCTLMQTYDVAVVVVYYSAYGSFPYFTLGDPGGEGIGIMSVRLGDNCVASKYLSFAGGEGAIASGAESFAYGEKPVASGTVAAAFGDNTIAGSYGQFVCGEYNANDSLNLFEVGNGDSSQRANAFEVGWNGNSKAAGTLSAGDFTKTGHGSAIGYKTERRIGVYTLASGTTFVTVPSSALTRITLGAGTWIIQAHAAFEWNNTGRRAMQIYSATGSAGATRSFVNQAATPGTSTNMQTMAIVQPTSSTTYTLQLAQNSGGALEVDLVLEAVRIV